MTDVKNPGSFQIDVPASALDAAVAAVEARQQANKGPAEEVEVEVPMPPAPAGGPPPPPAAADPPPAESPPPPVAPPPLPKRTPQDAVIEALIKRKHEATEALKQTQSEAKELMEARARLLAEFDNFKKRVVREKQEARMEVVKGLCRDLLPVVDNFERALGHADAEHAPADAKTLVQGIQLVSRQLLDVLKKLGVTPFVSKGEPFDPARHEAVAQRPASGDESPGAVIEEHQRGYMLGDVLLRPALVVVAGPKEG
jgi:molecular chaperone GrpE